MPPGPPPPESLAPVPLLLVEPPVPPVPLLLELPDMQVPPSHVPPGHSVPSGAVGFEQTPVLESQVPTRWHASLAVQVTGFDPVHTPAWQVSVCVHALPSLQVVPSAWLDQVVVELAGVQTSQAFVGFTVPAG
jgi:hypothetical protein